MALPEPDQQWPEWTSEDNPQCNAWFIRRVLMPLHAKVTQDWPSYRPQSLLSSIDLIRLTGLTHYKCTTSETWNHEFVVADICLEDREKKNPDLKLHMLYERSVPPLDDPDREKKRNITVTMTIPTTAEDRVKFLSSQELDNHLRNKKDPFKLSDSTMEISGQHFSFLKLGFLMAAHSIKYPQYNVKSTMCYWYAGSTLDCLSLAMQQSKAKASSFSSGTTYCENHIRSGILPFWRFRLRGYRSDWNRGSAELTTPPVPNPETEELLQEAEANAQRFNAHNILNGNSPSQLCQRADFPAECHQLFTPHLVMEDPIQVYQKKSGIRLEPEHIPGHVLLQEDIMGSDNDTQRLLGEARGIFYGRNRFHVWLDAFREFSKGHDGNPNSDTNIAPLLRNLTVKILVPNEDEEHDTESKSAESLDNMRYRAGRAMPRQWSEQRLHDLLQCALDPDIEIKISFTGFGVLDGSDLATHQIIKDVALEVKKIIAKFPRTKVYKTLVRNDEGPSQWRENELTSYWDTPSEEARTAVANGNGTFQQVMQCEIEEWSAPKGDGFYNGLMGRAIQRPEDNQ